MKVVTKSRRSDWLQKEIDALPDLVYLIKNKLIVPCISNEVILDGLGLRNMAFGSELSLFSDISFEFVSEPDFFGMTRIAFGRKHDPKAIRQTFLSNRHYARFNVIKDALGGNKNADAFLIWTANKKGRSL